MSRVLEKVQTDMHLKNADENTIILVSGLVLIVKSNISLATFHASCMVRGVYLSNPITLKQIQYFVKYNE